MSAELRSASRSAGHALAPCPNSLNPTTRGAPQPGSGGLPLSAGDSARSAPARGSPCSAQRGGAGQTPGPLLNPVLNKQPHVLVPRSPAGAALAGAAVALPRCAAADAPSAETGAAEERGSHAAPCAGEKRRDLQRVNPTHWLICPQLAERGRKSHRAGVWEKPSVALAMDRWTPLCLSTRRLVTEFSEESPAAEMTMPTDFSCALNTRTVPHHETELSDRVIFSN